MILNLFYDEVKKRQQLLKKNSSSDTIRAIVAEEGNIQSVFDAILEKMYKSKRKAKILNKTEKDADKIQKNEENIVK
jgi:hypothetical protein